MQLPDTHGLISPGGYYLQNGETKLFENLPAGLTFANMLRSPNGEEEFMHRQPARQSFFGKIGNAELVRGISDGYSLVRMIQSRHASARANRCQRNACRSGQPADAGRR